MHDAPGRQPPAFVPTLTEVVPSDPLPPGDAWAPAAEPPAAAPVWPPADLEATVDRVTDRVLATVMHRLEARVAEQVQVWWHAHAWQCGQEVARTLLDVTAADVRDAVAHALATDPAQRRT